MRWQCIFANYLLIVRNLTELIAVKRRRGIGMLFSLARPIRDRFPLPGYQTTQHVESLASLDLLYGSLSFLAPILD